MSTGPEKGEDRFDKMLRLGYTWVVYEIRVYQRNGGKRPFIVWLEALKDIRARAIIKARLGRVQLGNLGDYKPVGNGVYELRIDVGPGYRIYFGIDGTKVILLLLGGSKRKQQRDIKKAKEYWQDYLS